ncbi:hypothetical protein BGC_07980 [Burkholderia sp. 3C]
MATFAARKLADIADNTAHILGNELRAAAHGVELRSPHATSPTLQNVMREIRTHVPHCELDRYFAPDIEAIVRCVRGGSMASHCPLDFDSEPA